MDNIATIILVICIMVHPDEIIIRINRRSNSGQWTNGTLWPHIRMRRRSAPVQLHSWLEWVISSAAYSELPAFLLTD